MGAKKIEPEVMEMINGNNDRLEVTKEQPLFDWKDVALLMMLVTSVFCTNELIRCGFFSPKTIAQYGGIYLMSIWFLTFAQFKFWQWFIKFDRKKKSPRQS